MDHAAPQPGNSKRVKLDSLQLGPIRHQSLSAELTARLHEIHETFFEVDGSTFEERWNDFRRDVHPDRELEIWEVLSSAYKRFCRQRDWSLEAKREAYALLIRRSMCSEDEVMEQVVLKLLSPEEALELLRFVA
jgi:hypothetical protein